MGSVQFCTQEMLERFQGVRLLEKYIRDKKQEIEKHNISQGVSSDDKIDGRRLTNIGTFRAYLNAYLEQHPQIHQDMTLLVRQLAPSEKGIPIEIYVFSKIQDWTLFENIQGDIFDHILAILPFFNLAVFQNPAGRDFSKILSTSQITAS